MKTMRVLCLLLLCCSQAVFAGDKDFVSSEPADISAKILGGVQANPGAWPWIAALLYANVPNMLQAQFCSGVLVDATWVLTAAHCVDGQTSNKIQVAVGVFDLASFSGSRIALRSIRIHPGYNRTTLQNDIALLELVSPSKITPITLYSGQSTQTVDPSLLGRVVTAIGWGLADNTSSWYYPAKLRQVSLPVVADSMCNAGYPYPLLPSQFCAGYYEGKDTCYGDSGGPVVTQIDGAWVHAGIISYGANCQQYYGWYGVYTRTSKYIDFIKQYAPKIASTQGAAVPYHNFLPAVYMLLESQSK